MKFTSATSIGLQSLALLFATTATARDNGHEEQKALPFVQDFKPDRYLGTWYEVARLPTPIQPAETLAVAEYSAAMEDGRVTVRNSAFDQAGRKLRDIQGQAKLAEGEPPGRLLVSFGPVLPEVPNYHVLYVDKDYNYAVVGVPDRQSLWILARKVPVPEEALKPLREIARNAGFDVSNLIVAPWDRIAKTLEAGEDGAGEPATRSESK